MSGILSIYAFDELRRSMPRHLIINELVWGSPKLLISIAL